MVYEIGLFVPHYLMKYFVIFLIGIIFLSIPLYPHESSACSCIIESSDEALENSVAVFSGKVTKITEDQPTWPIISSAESVIVEFQVDRVWKGPSEKTIKVTTASDEGTCGYGFEMGKTYLVYSYEIEDNDPLVLKVSLCSKTSPIADASEDLSELGIDKIPNEVEKIILPPLKQQQNGVPADEIKCREGMYRGFSKSNGKAICATGYTLNKLIHRGWAESHTAISSATFDRPNAIVHDYCPPGTQLIQGGWYSTSKNPPVEVVSVEEIYAPENDAQGIEIIFNPTNNPETDGKSMIFVFVDCDSTFDSFEIIILPNTIEQRKNFVVYYPSNTETTLHFDNQDDIPYQIDGTSDNGNNSFTIWLSPENDWFIDEPPNEYEGVKYIELSASNPDTGEVYDWMNYIIYVTQKISK